MPSRRSFLATAALATAAGGCVSFPRFRPPPGTDWHAPAPEPGVLAPPSVTGEFVAAAGRRGGDPDEGRVVVFDAGTGDRRWRHDVGRPTGLVAADGSVYVGEKRGDGARVLAFDAESGRRQWTRTVDNLATAMAVARGTLYTAGGTLAALDTAAGTVRWERSQVGEFPFTVVLAPGDQLGADGRAVYFGDTAGVVALSPADGSPVWAWRPDRTEPTDVGPTPAGDTVYVGRGGTVAALDAGAARWRTSFGLDAQVVGVHDTGSSLLVAERTDEPPSDGFGTVYELAHENGVERNETRFETPVVRTASTDETFVVGTRAGRLVWTGSAPLFRRPETTVPGEGFVLGAAGRRAFAQTDDGTVWALSPPD